MCKLRGVNLKLNPNKCCFAAKNITFLGHVVSEDGTRPHPSKVEAVLHFPQPRTVTNVRSFLGLTGYYRKYVRGYALTRKDVDFVWDVGCQQAFQALRAALVEAPILMRPDFKRAFCLDVDWSPKGVEAILSQRREIRKGSSLCQQESDRGTEEVPSHGRGVLCTHMGHHAL